MSRAYVIMGVAGCGKSTIGAALADAIGARFLDGDDLHPASNIEKMSNGTPLNDRDREPWLHAVGTALGTAHDPLLIACSALKRRYRDLIRKGAGRDVTFLHLTGDRQVLERRMAAREGHFMPTSLLDSQYRDLEPLDADETHFCADLDQPIDDVVAVFAQAIKGETP